MKYTLSFLLFFLLSSLHAQNEPWRNDYKQVNDFYDGLAAVWLHNKKWGFINKKNKPLTSFVYDDAQPFEGGYSVVTKDDKKGFVNPQGKEIIPLVYENAEKFSEGLAAVKKEGKCVENCQNAPKE